MPETPTETAPRGRGRPRAEPAEAQRDRILAAATEVFARDGLGGARVDEVAASAGVNKAVLYRHFASKDELFEAALDWALERMRLSMLDAFAAPPASSMRDTLRLRVDAVFRFAADEPATFHLIEAANRSPAGGERVREVRRETVRQLSEVTRTRLADLGLPTVQAADMVAAMTYSLPVTMAVRLQSEPGWDRDAVADLVTEFIVGGLRHLFTEARDVYEQADRPVQP